ncbi:hypothetical protein HYU17_00785 [Candidatus Woesearchaeota archaeon]|nr:hypothetical protein [Candidatus Woesearchaeota archaeon]
MRNAHLLLLLIISIALITGCVSKSPSGAENEMVGRTEEKPAPPPLPQETPSPEADAKDRPQLRELNIYEDLVVGSGRLVINRTKLRLYGNLVVNGSGKLTVVDSEIVFVQDYNQQYRAYFRDDASLDMSNVRLYTGDKWFNFDYRGNVAVRMSGVKGNDCCTPWHGASENARFDITNSTIGLTISNNVAVTVRGKSSMFFELVLADVNGEFMLPKGDVDEFRLEIDNNRQNAMRIDVRDSSFYHWGATLDKHTNVTFEDTSITIGMNAGSDWQLPPPTVKASGLKAKKYDDYSLLFDTNKLRLLNSEVTSWYPQAWNGATIELEDSDLADLQNNGRDSKLVVRNSKVDIAIAGENVVQKYFDSEIRQDVIVHDEAEIHLYNTKVGGKILENGNGKVFINGKRLGN